MNLPSLSKAKIKYVRSLHNSKFRQKYNKYIAEGDKIGKVLLSNKQNLELLICTENWYLTNSQLLSDQRDLIFLAEKRDMDAISLLKTSSPVLMICEMPVPNDKLLLNKRTIYLDDIQDPGNLGTIIRTADWFGYKQIVMSPGTVSFYNPKVIQSAMGSHLNIQPIVMTLEEVKQVSDGKVYGTLLEGNPLNKSIIEENAIIVIGNEGRGISPQNMSLIDEALTISGASDRIAESLNASMALGIILSSIK